MRCKQLLPKSEVFENEILSGSERTAKPAKKMMKGSDRGVNPRRKPDSPPFRRSLILRMQRVLRRGNCALNRHTPIRVFLQGLGGTRRDSFQLAQ
jgi:hypothetical protein